jgi:hypothetical protein
MTMSTESEGRSDHELSHATDDLNDYGKLG